MFYVFFAEGFEETEALVPVDMLKRAGVEVLMAGVGKKNITGSHGITVKTDIDVDEVDLTQTDGIFLPGGMPGTENLYKNEKLRDVVSFCIENDKLVAAVCAAPIILGRMGILKGKNAVCFPGFENELTGALVNDKPCVADGNIITAKGAGCVFELSYEMISCLKDKAVADTVLKTIQHFAY